MMPTVLAAARALRVPPGWPSATLAPAGASRRGLATGKSGERQFHQPRFYRRSWRHHPVLLSRWTACILGLAVLGIIDLVHGVPHHVWGGVYLGLSAVWFVLWVMMIRRDEPPEEL